MTGQEIKEDYQTVNDESDDKNCYACQGGGCDVCNGYGYLIN